LATIMLETLGRREDFKMTTVTGKGLVRVMCKLTWIDRPPPGALILNHTWFSVLSHIW